MKLALDGAKPNRGHYSLKELEDLDILKYTITQNVDNLQIMVGSKSSPGNSWQQDPIKVFKLWC